MKYLISFYLDQPQNIPSLLIERVVVDWAGDWLSGCVNWMYLLTRGTPLRDTPIFPEQPSSWTSSSDEVLSLVAGCFNSVSVTFMDFSMVKGRNCDRFEEYGSDCVNLMYLFTFGILARIFTCFFIDILFLVIGLTSSSDESAQFPCFFSYNSYIDSFRWETSCCLSLRLNFRMCELNVSFNSWHSIKRCPCLSRDFGCFFDIILRRSARSLCFRFGFHLSCDKQCIWIGGWHYWKIEMQAV